MNHEELSAERLAELTSRLDDAFASRSGAALAGDPAARREILHTCRDYLLFVANQELDARLQVKCAPSDIVQNVLAKAVERFDAFEGDNQRALLAWLRRILKERNRGCASRSTGRQARCPTRKTGRLATRSVGEFRLEVVDPDQTPGTQAALVEDIGRLQQALERLSPDHEEVIRLRNWERLSFAEIGRRMGRSEEAAKKLWGRALIKLRDVLSEI